MPSRQEVLLDAAIAVLGSEGSRRLTHRAVDAFAGLPSGSTSNYFKTREALINAMAARFVEREQAIWATLTELMAPRTPAELAVALAAFVRRAIGPDRVMTLARYGLFVEAALHPDAYPQLAESAREIRRFGAQWLRAVGVPDPEAACEQLLDQLDGLILHQLAYPDPALDLEHRITRFLCVESDHGSL
ncbi:TetR/AcrR family transcriptional regulator [Actinoplanes sp. NPDC026619]|uniref:TetR/AcrR family transcriptional regulator n=1 Tax=Actinoplanes sp. NPDC026619 TaxID=3155798 RepID=UPI0033C93AA3